MRVWLVRHSGALWLRVYVCERVRVRASWGRVCLFALCAQHCLLCGRAWICVCAGVFVTFAFQRAWNVGVCVCAAWRLRHSVALWLSGRSWFVECLVSMSVLVIWVVCYLLCLHRVLHFFFSLFQ